MPRTLSPYERTEWNTQASERERIGGNQSSAVCHTERADAQWRTSLAGGQSNTVVLVSIIPLAWTKRFASARSIPSRLPLEC